MKILLRYFLTKIVMQFSANFKDLKYICWVDSFSNWLFKPSAKHSYRHMQKFYIFCVNCEVFAKMAIHALRVKTERVREFSNAIFVKTSLTFWWTSELRNLVPWGNSLIRQSRSTCVTHDQPWLLILILWNQFNHFD